MATPVIPDAGTEAGDIAIILALSRSKNFAGLELFYIQRTLESASDPQLMSFYRVREKELSTMLAKGAL